MYDGLSAVNIHRALSLVPAEVVGFLRHGFGALPARCAAQGLRHRIPRAHPRPDRVPRRTGVGHQPVRLLNHQPCGAAP